MTAFDDVRKKYPGWSDADIINDIATVNKTSPGAVSNYFGLSSAHSDAGWEWEAAKSNYLSGLGHIGGALGSETARNYATSMGRQADYERSMSPAPQSWDDMTLGQNGMAYLRQGAIGSAPYLLEAGAYAGADTLTGGALTPAILARMGTRMAPTLAKSQITSGVARGLTTDAATEAAGRGLARTAMTPVVTYPSSLGDVLGNQYEQAGTYDLGAAAPLAGLYAAANVAGIEGAMARGMPVNLLKAVERGGVKGAMLRGLGAGAEMGASEAGNETFQEMMNQAGRMAVDPTAGMFSPDALARYKESAIMGGLLGGLPGGVHGVVRRPSQSASETAPLPATEPVDLIQVVEPSMPLQNFIDQQIGLGRKSVPRAEVTAAFKEQIEPTVIVGEDGKPYTTTSAADVYDWVRRGSPGSNIPASAPMVMAPLPGLPPSDVVYGYPSTSPAPAKSATMAVAPALTPVEALKAQHGITRNNKYANNFVAHTVDLVEAGTITPEEQQDYLTRAATAWKDTGPSAVKQHTEVVKALDALVKGRMAEAPVKLTAKQQPVVEYMRAAFREGRAGDVVDAEGVLQYQKIADALGMARGSAKSFIDGAAKIIAESQGTTVGQMKAALKARAVELRTTQPSAQDSLGLAPSQQESVLDANELFGEDGGITAGMGIIESVGGSQSDIGGSEAPPGYVDSVEASDKAKAEAARNRAEWDAAVAREINRPEAATAGIDWNDAKSDSTPAWDELSLADREEFIVAYREQIEADASWSAIEAMQRDFERNLETEDATRQGGEPARILQDTRQIEDAGNATREPASAEGVRGGTQGAESDQQGQGNPLEARVAKLRESLGEKQNHAIDKLIGRYQSGDIDLERLEGELANYADQVEEGVSFSETSPAAGIDAAKAIATLKKLFFSPEKFDSLVTIVQSARDLKPAQYAKLSQANDPSKVAGFAHKGKIVLIADNIRPGQELGLFLHELGTHVGMEKLIGKDNMLKLADQITAWAGTPGRSTETLLARRAMRRTAGSSSTTLHQELIAYFIEEAVLDGIDPIAVEGLKNGALQSWFRTLWAAAKAALRKIGFGRFEDLTAQNLVDLAYGAAELELLGVHEPDSTQETIDTPVFSEAAVMDAARRVGGHSGEMLAEDASLAVKRLGLSLSSLHDLVADHKQALPAAETWYKSLMSSVAARNKLSEKAESIANAAADPKINIDKVNAFLSKSTFEQKWGYDATFKKLDGTDKTVQADPAMAVEFHKLSAAEQKLVKDVFAHGEEMANTKFEILKRLGLDKVFSASGKLAGPYAPLKRFGNYVAVLKSKELRAAEMADDAKKVTELKQSGEHYVVSYFDTIGQAKLFARENDAAHGGKWSFADAFAKSERIEQYQALPSNVLQKVLSAVKADGEIPSEARSAVEQLVKDMWFQSLDAHNARTNGLKRMNRAGYDADMLKSFLTHARAEARFLANMEHGGAINTAFYAMQQQAKDATTGKRVGQDVFNTFAAHYADNLAYQETPVQDRLMAMTSAWQLATSVGYHVTNAMQPFMVTVPKLAADFNNYGGAWRHVLDAYRFVPKMWSSSGFDTSEIRDPGLRAALKLAEEMGVLDVGMDSDLTQFDTTRTGIVPLDNASVLAKKATRLLRQVSRKVEVANRVSSAIAAYRMARGAGRSIEQAQDYAVRILQSTQGDFSRAGAPLLLKKLPKVMTQYKKYQFMMAALYARAFKDAFFGTEPETRAIGKRMLAYKLSHAAVASGLLGLPLMNVAGLVFSALGDDDEPKDLERSLREAIGDETLADLLLKGPLNFFGLDMSAKLGEDKIFSIAPYVDIDLSSRDGLAKTAMGLAGPSASVLGNMAEGVGMFGKGEYYKGVEKLIPKGPADAMKAFRIANEGFTLKNGDVMVEPEDINTAALIFDAFGLPSSEIKRLNWLRGQQYEVDRFFITRTKELRQAYTRAVREGDAEATGQLREDWMALQAGKDRVRPLFNNSSDALKKQPLSTLLKSPQQQAKRERKLQSGVPNDD